MTALAVVCFGCSIFFAIQAVYWVKQARAEGRRAWFLGRILNEREEFSTSNLNKFLAATPSGQRTLENIPFSFAIASLIMQSGLRLTVVDFIRQGAAGACIGAVAGFFLSMGPAGVASLALCGCSAPLLRVVFARGVRHSEFEKQLPQALELLILFLRAGRTLPQSFVAASEKLPAPIGEEFSVCAEEYRMGRTLEDSS